jgi:hypothetical protein
VHAGADAGKSGADDDHVEMLGGQPRFLPVLS